MDRERGLSQTRPQRDAVRQGAELRGANRVDIQRHKHPDALAATHDEHLALRRIADIEQARGSVPARASEPNGVKLAVGVRILEGVLAATGRGVKGQRSVIDARPVCRALR